MLVFTKSLLSSRIMGVLHGNVGFQYGLYYEVGHSYNDSDRLGGIVENEIRKTDGVFTPDQWVDAASRSTSSVKGPLTRYNLYVPPKDENGFVIPRPNQSNYPNSIALENIFAPTPFHLSSYNETRWYNHATSIPIS